MILVVSVNTVYNLSFFSSSVPMVPMADPITSVPHLQDTMCKIRVRVSRRVCSSVLKRQHN